MSRPKRTRRDANHSHVIQECRALGIVVWDTADLGGEVLDTVMFWRGTALPVEIKAPGKENDLTENERISIEKLGSLGVRAVIATKAEDVLRAFQGES